jgi:hypothetical protein
VPEGSRRRRQPDRSSSSEAGADARRVESATAKRGWRFEEKDGSYQLVDAARGTLVAADWAAGSYGLSLADIERVLREA